MKKQTKKYTLIITLFTVLIVGVLLLNNSGGNPSASSKENTKVVSEIESSELKEEEETEEKIEFSSIDQDAEINDAEKEAKDLEEIPAQEEIPKEEESVTENEIASTTIEEKIAEESTVESKENTEQSSMKPTEAIEKSSVGMTEYLLPFSNSEERVETTTHVVLHFSSNALGNPQDPYHIEDTYNIFKDYGVSAHYVIDREGKKYLFVPENRIAYHAGRGEVPAFPEYGDQLNHYSIGIELLAIGTREEMTPIISAEIFDLIDPAIMGYTEAQYQSLDILLDDILARHPNIQKDRNHIIGHDEYSVGTKTDPGSLFNWSKIGL